MGKTTYWRNIYWSIEEFWSHVDRPMDSAELRLMKLAWKKGHMKHYYEKRARLVKKELKYKAARWATELRPSRPE